MKRYACLALAFAATAVAPAAFAQDGTEGELCLFGGISYNAVNYEEALRSLRGCFEDTSLPELDRAIGYAYFVRALEAAGRIDETIEHLRKITSPPWSRMDGFIPPTLAMQKLRSEDTYVGVSQPQLVIDLAVLLSQQGKADEALVEARRAIRVARTTRADVMAEEAAAWMTYAGLMQEKGDAKGMLVGMVRAYVRGSDHESLEEYVSQQSPEAQAQLKRLRATMTEQRPIMASRDAWAASLGKPFDPSTDAEGGAALLKVQQVEAEEAALVGPVEY